MHCGLGHEAHACAAPAGCLHIVNVQGLAHATEILEDELREFSYPHGLSAQQREALIVVECERQDTSGLPTIANLASRKVRGRIVLSLLCGGGGRFHLIV